jgi:hypothetical protein
MPAQSGLSSMVIEAGSADLRLEVAAFPLDDAQRVGAVRFGFLEGRAYSPVNRQSILSLLFRRTSLEQPHSEEEESIGRKGRRSRDTALEHDTEDVMSR